jgi:hypothetical protein
VNISDHVDLFYTDFPANPESAAKRGESIGINNRNVCEISAWCWELDEQVRRLAEERGVKVLLMGGTAAQLRLDLREQRGSRDDDYLTAASEKTIAALMQALADRFASVEEPYFRPELKTPGERAQALPMVTYEVPVPALLGHTDADGVAKHVLKLEFHLVDALPPSESLAAQVFALERAVESEVPILPHQIALKLVTLTAEPIGIPDYREDDIPKQLNDIDLMLARLSGAEHWAQLRQAVEDDVAREAAAIEIEPPAVDAVWNGIEARLERWADVSTERELQQLVNDAQGLFPRGIRLGHQMWRARVRRITYACRCARSNEGAAAWAYARTEEERLNSDQKAGAAEIAARWRDERGAKAPGPLRAFASVLWWEYLVTREGLLLPANGGGT